MASSIVRRTFSAPLSADEARVILNRVVCPGRCGNNIQFYDRLFESWTSYDPLRMRRLRLRKRWMPFVDVGITPRGDAVEVDVRMRPTRRRVIGIVAAVAILAIAAIIFATTRPMLVIILLLAYLVIMSVVVWCSSEMEVVGTTRMLQAVLTPEHAKNPKLLERFIQNRMWIR